jgi:hypothetical protein
MGIKPAYSELIPSVEAIFVKPDTRPEAYCTSAPKLLQHRRWMIVTDLGVRHEPYTSSL